MTGVAGPTALLARARDGDRGALARLISRLERGGAEADALADMLGTAGAAHVIGVTGPPGAGKSTLLGRLVATLAAAGRRPAVLAVDPSSSITGGAILGDRVRMDGLGDAAFVRSMATRGHRGGLALALPPALRLLAHAGFDPVLVETTGVGQAEVDVAAAADTVVLVLAPGWGDAVQANKAGLLEVADVLVVNKADRDGARAARRELEAMLDLGHVSGLEARVGARPAVVSTVATTGAGVEELRAAVEAHLAHLVAGGTLAERRRRRLRLEVAARVARALEGRAERSLDAGAGRAALAAADAGRLSPAGAARAVIEELTGRR